MLEEIIKITGAENVQRDVFLSDLSYWNIGGKGDYLVEPTNVQQLSKIVRLIHKNKVPLIVIGDASNLLFSDMGFRGVVIRIANKFTKIEFEKSGVVIAQAGVWVPCFVRRVAMRGLSGCTHAIGIPGRLGGLITMNGGSMRKSISEQLVDVKVLNENGELEIISKEECKFSYRYSVLQDNSKIIVSAKFQYLQGNANELRREMLGIMRDRKSKFPRKEPSCGSVFLSTPEMYKSVGPPGKLIEEAGFKGMRRGGAMVSLHHANFIINKNQASSEDVLMLIKHIRKAVFENTGYKMDCEVKYVSPEGLVCPAHQARADS